MEHSLDVTVYNHISVMSKTIIIIVRKQLSYAADHLLIILSWHYNCTCKIFKCKSATEFKFITGT